MERIHFVLKTGLITVNLLQIIHDPNVRLDLIFLLGDVYSLFWFRLLFFDVFFWSLLFVYDFEICFWSSSASRAARLSRTGFIRSLGGLVIELILWNWVILMVVREGILRARLTHWIIKIIYEIKNKYYEGFSKHHFATLLSFLIWFGAFKRSFWFLKLPIIFNPIDIIHS